MNYRRFIFLFIVSFSLVFSNQSFSQHILGAISAGINLSQVDGDQVYGYNKVGLNIGSIRYHSFWKKQTVVSHS